MSKYCHQCGSPLPAAARFCPQCAAPVAPANAEAAAGGSAGAGYDVFLSYSHRDSENYGMEYVLRIKREIEEALRSVVPEPKVFLDAEALHLGDLWHSRIMESLSQCKAFVCLVSDAYFRSEYSTRERIWWNFLQTHNGRFLDGPYPIYFVKLEEGIFAGRREVRELMAMQTDNIPWFDLGGLKQQLQENFIRARLQSVTEAVRSKVEAFCLAKKSYCSVLPPLYKNFVGRVTELRQLHEHFSNGRYPVIQAFGGVGKTELSIAYAYGFADQYPMGRFLFRMEGVKSWDDAFAAALQRNGMSENGTPKTVSAELAIDGKLLEGNDPVKLHRAAADALIERAAQGKLLILLDNLDEDTDLLKPTKMRDFLCGYPIPGNIHILATTRGSLSFSERDIFSSYELGNLKDSEAFEMLCLTGNGQYPFDRNPPPEENVENSEYRAALEVIRFLGGHAWSLEIVSAFMADNYDPHGCSFADELKSLRESGISFISSNVGARPEEDRAATPVKLLAPTLERLAALELGEEILELAVFAACFDADEIPMYLLEEYWVRNFPGVVCSKGASFFFAVNRLAKYHLIRREGEYLCKMHRLAQSVFLSRKGKYLSRIAATLSECSFVPAKYWVAMLRQTPELIDVCPQDGTLDGEAWVKLLDDPVFADRCPWEWFTGKDWSLLLRIHPEYASRDPPWELFDGCDWSKLLRDRPDFSDRCDWSKLDGLNWMFLIMEQPGFFDRCDFGKLDGRNWAMIVSRQPQFADECEWSKLDGWNWKDLLEKQPIFADKCDWSKLSSRAWARLLMARPEFSVHCDWRNLGSREWALLLAKHPDADFVDQCPWNELSGEGWADILGAQPQFSGRCDWDKLDGPAWSNLLKERPEFSVHCDWSKLDGFNWALLLAMRPQFADKCDWSKLDYLNWALLLAIHPDADFVDQCPWDELDGRNWEMIVSRQPQFADKCDWSKLDGEVWAELLKAQPQFADKCDWSKLDGRNWVDLLETRPQFAGRCDWNNLNENDLSLLVRAYPQLVKHCDPRKLPRETLLPLLEKQPRLASRCDLDKLTGGDWAKLIGRQPDLAPRCDLDKLAGVDWVTLLGRQPRFADRCDWSKLGGFEWMLLLMKRPEFADKCDWSKLDGDNWTMLLRFHPAFADNCDWRKLGGENWAKLLEERPEFTERCDWSKLDDRDLHRLFYARPQLIDRCDWKRLNVVALRDLLGKRPELADRCDWNGLDGWQWAVLLMERPEFAERCDWSKLDGDDWMLLLRSHPAFSDNCDWRKLGGENWAKLLNRQPRFAANCDLSKLSEDERRILLEKHPELKNRR